MNRKRPTSDRAYRDLTPQERRRLEKARAETEASRDRILAEGRVRKEALAATRTELERTISALKESRLRLGLSLADVEKRSGLKRSALSRLENDPNANPTFLTLQRYAIALGMRLSTSVRTDTD